MNPPRIIGVDPGLTGGIALLVGDKVEACWDIPTVDHQVNADEVMRILRDAKPDLATIEFASARPGQGVASMFRYGQAYGSLRTAISACGVQQWIVTPATWKRHFKLDRDKEKARALAIKLWPGSNYFNHKSDHGRAEAALIAFYGYQTFAK